MRQQRGEVNGLSESYLRELYRLAMLEYRLGIPGAIDELARITKTATILYGFEFTASLQEVGKEVRT